MWLLYWIVRWVVDSWLQGTPSSLVLPFDWELGASCYPIACHFLSVCKKPELRVLTIETLNTGVVVSASRSLCKGMGPARNCRQGTGHPFSFA